MAESEAREIEQTGSKIVDELLSAARESGMTVKVTEEADAEGYTFWTAEFRIPAWGRPGSLLRQQQEYDNLRVIWMRPPGKGRRPRMLDATRRELFRYKTIKTPKGMRSELRSMRREAEKATARLALRRGGETWRLEVRGHRQEPLSATLVTLEEAEHLVAVASELTAILAEEIRFYQWDRERQCLVLSALVPQEGADPAGMAKRAEARAEGLIPNEGNYLATREDEGGYVSRVIVQRDAAVALVAAGITSGGDVTSDGETVTIAYDDGTRTVRRTFDDGAPVIVNPSTPNAYEGAILRPARSGCFRVRESQHGTACDHPAVELAPAPTA
jgi:hypothetical protein